MVGSTSGIRLVAYTAVDHFIVFLGMGLASLILFPPQTVTGFALGFFLRWMFFSSDIWVIIVSE